jgi:hypothetical protein
MRKKFIFINAGILILFVAPTILYRFNSHYECTAGLFGIENKVVWKTRADKYKKAAAQAISACKSNSDRPDRCDVLVCKNYFF